MQVRVDFLKCLMLSNILMGVRRTMRYTRAAILARWKKSKKSVDFDRFSMILDWIKLYMV